MKRRSSEDSVFSLSALDLFASAMGAFMILALVMIPYYQNKPQDVLEAEVEALSEQLAQAEAEQQEVERYTAAVEAENRDLQGAAEEAEELKKKMGESIQFAPLEIIVMMDVSGSMERAVEGIKADIGALAQVFSRVSPQLSFGVIGYRETPIVIQPRGIANPNLDGGISIQQLQKEIDSLESENGFAYVEQAVGVGVQIMNQSRGSDAVQVLVLLGDAAPIERGASLLREPEDEPYIARAYELIENWTMGGEKRKFSSIFFQPERGSSYFTDPNDIQRRLEAEKFFREIARRAGNNGRHSESSSSMFSDILDAVLDN